MPDPTVSRSEASLSALERELCELIPGGDESDLRPCLVLVGDHRLNLLAKDYEAAVLGMEFICSEAGIERRSAVFVWGDEAIEQGWQKP